MKYIYFKITTIPQLLEEDFDNSDLERELYYNKYKDVRELDGEKLKEDYFKNASKSPTFAKIYSITVGYIPDGTSVPRIKVFKGEERIILQNFLNLLNEHFSASRIAYWNSEFTLPFITTRAGKNKIETALHKDLQHHNKKPWNLTGIDINSYNKGVSWFSASLEETAFNFNLPTNFVSGEDVYSLWAAQEHEKLDLSSIQEVFTLINIHRLLEKESVLEELYSEVVILQEDTKEKEMPILVKIHSTKNLQVKELAKQLKERGFNKKTPKEEKETVKNLVLSHYLEKIEVTDMDKKEKEEINNNRTKEVEEFFKAYEPTEKV